MKHKKGKVVVGINSKYKCKNSICKLNGKKSIKPIGTGIFCLSEKAKL